LLAWSRSVACVEKVVHLVADSDEQVCLAVALTGGRAAQNEGVRVFS